MIQQDVINCLERQSKWPCICISEEMDKFIRNNFKEGNDNGKFYKVYRAGNDAKYGHYMVNPISGLFRSSTFDEFYGSGIVD